MKNRTALGIVFEAYALLTDSFDITGRLARALADLSMWETPCGRYLNWFALCYVQHQELGYSPSLLKAIFGNTRVWLVWAFDTLSDTPFEPFKFGRLVELWADVYMSSDLPHTTFAEQRPEEFNNFVAVLEQYS